MNTPIIKNDRISCLSDRKLEGYLQYCKLIQWGRR